MEETEQQRIEREQVQKEYKGALIKMILAIVGFVIVMFVALMVIMFGSMALGLGFLTLFAPIIAVVCAVPFALWFIRSPIFRNFRKAAVKNAMYSRNVREAMEDSREAMKSGPGKQYMDEFKQQMKDELREEMRQEQTGYGKPYN